ncbi:ABC transporter related protein [Candidatus Sulfotelmatobacter sp. SbA7]|jgi:ABC-2 type transport system ATP-binding protein|nr:ABC transporter related protein [Candidatus Sulfotelmatobacter sp. SbA7]
MGAALEFENVGKEYRSLFGRRRFPALDGFNLRVEVGEILGFLGPNGAGKTTAIHLAMGFMRPTSGRGRLLGEPFGHAATRSRVGFLPENVALYPRRAEQLVRFYGALNGMKAAQLGRRTAQVLEIVRLQDDAKRNVSKFSRGMQQRVGLAQALVNDPELLILDEPTSALDPLARVAVRELLLNARAAGKTIFLSSHLLSEVELVCDRVAVLHRGRLVRLGTTADLLQVGQRTQIVARRIAADGFVGAVARNGDVSFSVPANQQRAALERVWQLGGEVISVNPERRSLEEIFLQVTADKSVAAGAA